MIHFDTSYLVGLYYQDAGWRAVRMLAATDLLQYARPDRPCWGDSTNPAEYGYDSTYVDRTSMNTCRGRSGWAGNSWPTSPGTANRTM